MSDDQGAKVIPLFGDQVPRSQRSKASRAKPPDQGKSVEDLLSDPLRASISDVENSLELLYEAESIEAFVAEVRRIKAEVRRWPSRG